MSKLDAIDHFFQVKEVSDRLKWYPVTVNTSGVYGLMQHSDGRFCRMPRETAEAVGEEALTESVSALYTNTSGGRLRLVTDSKVIAVRVELGNTYGSSRGTFLGTAGMDLYEKSGEEWIYIGCLPPEPMHEGARKSDGAASWYESALRFGTGKRRELMIHFPLYADVYSVELGLDPEAVWEKDGGYSGKKVVFYGSSITQGGCAPMPGVSYPAILSRKLNCDFVNLGFSDGARVEQPMLEYLCSLPMDVLVFDYDHNAPRTEYLENTHLKAYQYIRRRRPDLPVILASAPFAHLDEVWEKRREIILNTYRYALENGDTKIAFVDGAAMFPDAVRNECSVDGIHPNGLGMSCMASAFEPILRRFLTV